MSNKNSSLRCTYGIQPCVQAKFGSHVKCKKASEHHTNETSRVEYHIGCICVRKGVTQAKKKNHALG